jgi:glutathionyl-hydroquinone reductase
VRKLKGLEEIIPYTSVHWEMLEKGKHISTWDRMVIDSRGLLDNNDQAGASPKRMKISQATM